MDYKKFCERCKHYDFNLKDGIICALTKMKPNFEDTCKDFILNPDKNKQETSRGKMYSSYEGIGGWLLLFILSLTIFSPLITIYNFISGNQDSKFIFYRIEGLQNYLIIDGFFSMLLMIFSIYAGIKLWRVLPNAVKTAKTYLIVFLCYSIFIIFPSFMIDFPSENRGIMTIEIFKVLFRSFVYFIIWYSYLNKSKRVYSTYRV